jgi:hypothetical protein
VLLLLMQLQNKRRAMQQRYTHRPDAADAARLLLSRLLLSPWHTIIICSGSHAAAAIVGSRCAWIQRPQNAAYHSSIATASTSAAATCSSSSSSSSSSFVSTQTHARPSGRRVCD